MLTDNGHLIVGLIKNKGARFDRTVFDGKAHYIALNRAARRFMKARSARNKLKNLGIKVDLELNAIS